MRQVSDRLKAALALRDITGAELGRRCGINKGTISRYVRGEVIPKQNTIYLLSQALGVSPAWLLGFDVELDGTPRTTIDIDLLTDNNRELLLAYYKALIDAQEASRGKSEI